MAAAFHPQLSADMLKSLPIWLIKSQCSLHINILHGTGNSLEWEIYLLMTLQIFLYWIILISITFFATQYAICIYLCSPHSAAIKIDTILPCIFFCFVFYYYYLGANIFLSSKGAIKLGNFGLHFTLNAQEITERADIIRKFLHAPQLHSFLC